MNGCIYKTADGQCEKFSDKTRNTMSWCVGDEPCAERTPSYADRIRAMTDEELAQWICSHITECSRCEGRHHAGYECEFRNGRSTGLTMWLKSPEEVDNG